MKPEDLAKLTPEEKRIRIAELCGWTKVKNEYHQGDWWRAESKDGRWVRELPDYLNDLNAMHEAEKVLNADQVADYAKHLSVQHPTYCVTVLDGRDPSGDFWWETFTLIHATAAQRADAFLRTFG